jgi:IS605 OrfB family transposase
VNISEEDNEDIMQDFILIIMSFCAKIYGHRRSKRKTESIVKELVMKFNRSSVCHFNHLTSKKKAQVEEFLLEYSKAVNYFIQTYQDQIPKLRKFDLLLAIHIQKYIKESNTWFSARTIKNAFAEGYGMVQSAKTKSNNSKSKKYYSPKHYSKSAILSTTNFKLEDSSIKEFDMIGILYSIGRKQKIHIPLKKHKQFNKWNDIGKRASSIILYRNRIQFNFEIKTERKKKEGELIGIDIGVNRFIQCSNGVILGEEYKSLIEKLHRKVQGSKAYYKCKEEIKSYINKEVKKLPFDELQLIVIEKLKGLKNKMKVKRRLTKNNRRFISNWNYRQVLGKIKAECEHNRVSWRSVLPYYTSQDCPICNHRDKKNRKTQDTFKCTQCGYEDNADFVASKNILDRFLTGAYCPGCKV